MFARSMILSCIFLLGVVASAQAAPPAGAQPNFGPAIYADGELWGTKGTAALPPPNDHNAQSFDALYVVHNGVQGQVPVGEAAPGNPDYNAGRWNTHQVMWLAEPVLLTSEADILYYEGVGDLVIVHGTFPGGPPAYFQCPLLPVK